MARPLGLSADRGGELAEGFGYPLAAMTVGELVFANVVDHRVWETSGPEGPSGIYLLGSPGTALPFHVYRAWKVGTGMVREEVHFYGPTGRLVHRMGPSVRRMIGTMDLTVLTDTVEDARFDETGTYLASFVIDDEIVGEIEVPVLVQLAPAKLPKEIEDGFRRSDVIWAGVEANGRRKLIPVWFAYKDGRIFLLSQRTPGPEEQSIPGVPSASELLIVTRRKLRDTALHEFPASMRILEGPEWEAAAKLLADKRKSRAGAPGESIARWRGSCDIAELTPVIPA